MSSLKRIGKDRDGAQKYKKVGANNHSPYYVKQCRTDIPVCAKVKTG